MASFDIAQSKVAIAEGGYQNNPNDAGNWTGGKVNVGTQIGTNYGISAPTLQAYLGRTPTVSDMQNLSYSTALDIYKSNYWDAIGGDSINSDSIAQILYDGAVNEGVGFISGAVGDTLGTKVSAPFSSNVVSQINSADQQAFFDSIKQKRIDKYGSIGGKFLSEWLYRINQFSFTDLVDGATVYVKRNWVGVSITATLLIAGIVALILYRKKIIKLGNKA